jgi:hypothetical protein
VRLLHGLTKTHVSSDDPDLVSRAGLVPVITLAQRAGLGALVATHVRPDGPRVLPPCLECPRGLRCRSIATPRKTWRSWCCGMNSRCGLLRDQRVQAALGAPGQVAAQVGFGVLARAALKRGQVGSHCQPKPVSERLRRIGGRGGQFGERSPCPDAVEACSRREADQHAPGGMRVDLRTVRADQHHLCAISMRANPEMSTCPSVQVEHPQMPQVPRIRRRSGPRHSLGSARQSQPKVTML